MRPTLVIAAALLSLPASAQVASRDLSGVPSDERAAAPADEAPTERGGAALDRFSRQDASLNADPAGLAPTPAAGAVEARDREGAAATRAAAGGGGDVVQVPPSPPAPAQRGSGAKLNEGPSAPALSRAGAESAEDLDGARRVEAALYGQGHAGTLGVPSLVHVGSAVAGGSIELRFTSSSGVEGATGWLVVGTQESSIAVRGGGKILCTDDVLLDRLHVEPGTNAYSLSIPAELEAGSLYVQVVQVDAGALGGYAMTQGLEIPVR